VSKRNGTSGILKTARRRRQLEEKFFENALRQNKLCELLCLFVGVAEFVFIQHNICFLIRNQTRWVAMNKLTQDILLIDAALRRKA